MIDFTRGNAFELIKDEEDLSYDIIFSDPPYCLGSELETKDYTNKILSMLEKDGMNDEVKVLIENNNKLDIKGAGSDFMSKWDAPKGKDWEVFFKESFRILKHGGFLMLFGMEEAGALFTYYASQNGYELNMEILYMYAQSFPKNVNLGKAIDKKLGNEREVIGKQSYTNDISMKGGNFNNNGYEREHLNITKSKSELGQKYENYHSGKKPLKANKETVYVFHKPLKTKSYVGDLLAYENGDETIHVSAWDIGGNRIEHTDDIGIRSTSGFTSKGSCYLNSDKYEVIDKDYNNNSGRYPSQLLFDPLMAERLDEQSGVLKSGGGDKGNKKDKSGMFGSGKPFKSEEYGVNEGGASRYFETIPYLDPNQEKFIFSSKVSKYERNAGLDLLLDKERFGQGNYSTSPKCNICNKTINGTNDHTKCEKDLDYKLIYERTEENSVQKNNHPCCKGLNLNKKILDLVSSPNRPKEKILIPFSGVWSEIIGAIASGFKEENIRAYELSEEYPKIGKARLKFWRDNDFFFKIKDKKEFNKVKAKVEKPLREEEEDDIMSFLN